MQIADLDDQRSLAIFKTERRGNKVQERTALLASRSRKLVLTHVTLPQENACFISKAQMTDENGPLPPVPQQTMNDS